MRKKGIKTHKAIALLILALAAVDFTTPVLAMDTVTSGKVLDQVNGKYGADLRDVTGATVRTDYSNAYIENTQTNSILNWDRLNTAPKQSLNYIMKDGQTSLNNVVGVGLSQFAGAINAEKGRVIISNPNGILFENGSYVNANALTLTTHQASIDANNQLHLYGGNNNASIIFEGGNYATGKVRLNIANDLNIVSNNIDINNAVIMAKDTRLVTADGVTFFAINDTNKSSNFNVAINKNNYIDNGNININNSTFAIKDKTTGKISILSRGDVSVKNTELDGKTAIDAMDRNVIKNSKTEVIASNTTTEDSKIDGSNLSFWQDLFNKIECIFTGEVPITTVAGKTYKTTETTTTTTKNTYDMLAGRGNVTLSNIKAYDDVDVKGSNINISNSTFNNALNLTSEASKLISYVREDVKTDIITREADQFIVDRATPLLGLALDGHFNLDEVTPTTSTSTVLGEAIASATTTNAGSITLDKVTSSNTVKASGNTIAMYNSTVDNFDFKANNVKVQNVIATGNKVSEIKATNKADVRNSQFKTIRAAAADITFTDTDLVDSNLQATNNVKFSRTDSRKSYSVKNSTVSAKNIEANDMNISDSLIVADNNISANSSKVSNTEMNATNNIYAQNANIENSDLIASNDIIVSGSKIAKSRVNATKDVKLQDTTLNNTKVTGRKGFLRNATLENGSDVTVDYVTNNSYAENETVENLVIKNSKLKSNKNNINLKDTLIENGSLETANGKDVNIDTRKDVKLAGANIGGNLNITRAGNVVISNSKEAGNQYIPSLATKDSVTDYDKTKFNESYFTDIINDYGSDYGKGTKLSVIKGDVNISNAKSSLIINSIVGGNLTTENIYVGSDLINSMVVGDYNPNRIATSETSVYDSFIGGNFERKYEDKIVDNPTILPITNPEKPINNDKPTTLPITNPDRPINIDKPTTLPDTSKDKPVNVDKPTTLPDTNQDKPVVNPKPSNSNNENSSTTNVNQINNDKDSLNYNDEHNKRRFGNGVDTRFQKRFSPRGFAAEEEQINEMKSQTKSSIVKTEGNKVKFTKSFHAY